VYPPQGQPGYPQQQQQQAYPLAVRPQPGVPQPYGQHQQQGYPPQQQQPYGQPGYQQPINVVVQNNMVPYGQRSLVRVSDRNKWVSVLLAFFVGGFGGHKFYLGNTGAGVVYLMFCWTGIPLLVSLVEMLMLAVMSEREFEIRYNHMLGR